MPEDDDLFRRHMRSLGVDRLGGSGGRDDSGEASEPTDRPAEGRRERRSRSRRREDAEKLPAEERELFRRAIAALDEEPPPDKDRPGRGSDGGPPAKVRISRRAPLSVERRLDLHGATADEARRRLEAFLEEARATGARTALVVTGRGRHSPGGRSVLRASVEGWLRRRASGHVLRYGVAPAALGGDGAFVLWLRPRRR